MIPTHITRTDPNARPGIVWSRFVHAKRGAIMSRALLCGVVSWLVTG